MATQNGDNITDVYVEDYINTNYREFSFYVLTDRGIPSVYDGLSNVQRLILLNAPSSLVSTGTLIGNCFASGYHHGDASLAGAISKLTRSYDNAYSLLSGYGFFGNSIKGASAFRYTKSAIGKETKADIAKYAGLNNMGSDYLRLDYPMGLVTTINGIGVGYSSIVLPRKKEEILAYLAGKQANLMPHFIGFKGKIEKQSDISYIISSDIQVSKDTIRIIDLPPTARYETLMDKLGEYFMQNDLGKIVATNNCKSHVDVNIRTKGLTTKQKEDLLYRIGVFTRVTVKEQYIFVDGEDIVMYDSITDYLDDFKSTKIRNDIELMEYDISISNYELIFLQNKLKFIDYMSKNINLDYKSVNAFITNELKIPDDRMRDRMLNIQAYKINSDEYQKTITDISDMKKAISVLDSNLVATRKKLNKMPKSKMKNLVTVS